MQEMTLDEAKLKGLNVTVSGASPENVSLKIVEDGISVSIKEEGNHYISAQYDNTVTGNRHSRRKQLALQRKRNNGKKAKVLGRK